MDLVTPFDLVEMFPTGRTLAIVGNAPSLRGSGLGRWVDSHDVVVRFNECALAEFAEDVGGRTDILVTNPYPEARTRPLLDGAECRLVLVINPQTRRGDRQDFEAYVGRRAVLFTYTPDLGFGHASGLTTGTYAIGLLPAILQPKRLSVAGFTSFLDHTAHHYWSDETPPGAAKHDHVENARALLAIIRRWAAIATVTAEIAWLARRVGVPLDGRITVKALPDRSWSEGAPEPRP